MIYMHEQYVYILESCLHYSAKCSVNNGNCLVKKFHEKQEN